jgi:hypothetical protein
MTLPLISDEQIRSLCKKLKEKEEIMDLFQTNGGDALKMLQRSGQSLYDNLQLLPNDITIKAQQYSIEFLRLNELYYNKKNEFEKGYASQIDFQTVTKELNLNLFNPINKLSNDMNRLLEAAQPYLTQKGGRKHKGKQTNVKAKSK